MDYIYFAVILAIITIKEIGQDVLSIIGLYQKMKKLHKKKDAPYGASYQWFGAHKKYIEKLTFFFAIHFIFIHQMKYATLSPHLN